MKAINLIPSEQRRGAGGVAGRTGGVVYVIILGLLALVALGVVYGSAVHQVATHKTALASVTDEVNAVQADVASLQPYVNFETVSAARVSSVASITAQRFNWPLAMAQVALALPTNVTLTSLSGTASGGASATPATPATSGTPGTGSSTATAATPATAAQATSVNAPTLALNGCSAGSPSVGQVTVATLLTRVRALKDVTSAFVQSYSSTGCRGVTFNLTVTYDNDYGIPPSKLRSGTDSTVGG